MVRFGIPPHMKKVDVAKTFAAYLMGPLAFENSSDEMSQLRNGPFRKDPTSDSHWQLDDTNDFWLHIEDDGEHATIWCRYPGQGPIIEAAVKLFKARFLRQNR